MLCLSGFELIPAGCPCTLALLSTRLFFMHFTWDNSPNYRTKTCFFHYLLNWKLAKGRFFPVELIPVPARTSLIGLDRMTHNVPGWGPVSSGSSIKRQNCGMFMPPFFSLNTIIFFWYFRGLFVWVRFFSELGVPWRSLPSSPPYHFQVCWYLLWQIQKMYSNLNPACFEISLKTQRPLPGGTGVSTTS